MISLDPAIQKVFKKYRPIPEVEFAGLYDTSSEGFD